jgi:hypothetical protein
MGKLLIDLMAEALKANGYDGLVSPEAECGCLADDELAPCGECWCGCEPGYRGPGEPDLGHGDWAIYRTKEHRDLAVKRAAERASNDDGGHAAQRREAEGDD